MRRLHVDYGEYLIRLENSGKAVFRSNKTVMARRRFPNLSLCHHLYLLVRHASLTGRSAFLPGRPASLPGRPAPRRGAGRPGSGNFSNAFFIRGTTADRHSPYEQAGRTIREGAKPQTKERAVPLPLYERTGRYGPILSAQVAIRRPNRFFAFMPSVFAMLKAHPM